MASVKNQVDRLIWDMGLCICLWETLLIVLRWDDRPLWMCISLLLWEWLSSALEARGLSCLQPGFLSEP